VIEVIPLPAQDALRLPVTIQDGGEQTQYRIRSPAALARARRNDATPVPPRNRHALIRPAIAALRASLLLALAMLAAVSVARAETAGAGLVPYAEGRALYEAGAYEEAARMLEQAVALEPQNSDLHLWLGRSYGRAAERAGWLRAVQLAHRTRREFETAVALDPGNRAAWSYLAEYYRRAPVFLGGSREKARDIDARLADAQRR
jgi:tetratricopeptide (TPR) repeat protein